MAKDWSTILIGGAAVVALGVGAWFLFKKEPSPGTFNFTQPTATPNNVTKGEVVKIHCEIAMTGGEDFDAIVIVQVSEGSIFASPGDLLEQKSFNIKMKPGQTAIIDWDHTSKGAIGTKDISVLINKGSDKLDQHHFDDVFSIGGEGVSFDILQPIVQPSTVSMGQNVTIKCPVTSTSDNNQSIRIRMQVAESSVLPSPGDLLEEQTSNYFTIKPGETKNITFTHKTRGAAGSKDISVFIDIAGTSIDSHHFDDAFHVTSGGGAVKGYIAEPIEVNYGSEFRNEALPIDISNPGQTIEFVFGIQNTSDSSQRLGATVVVTKPDGSVMNLKYGPTSIASNNGVTVKLTSSEIITAAGSYRVDVKLWYAQDDSTHQLDFIGLNPGFTVASGGTNAIVTITNPVVPYGEVLYFTFSGFHPFSQIVVSVDNITLLTEVATWEGKGIGSFIASPTAGTLTPGNYTLVVTDNYGHSGSAIFTILPQQSVPTLIVLLAGQGGILTVEFYGFMPNAELLLSVNGINLSFPVTDENGAGGADFPTGLGPGTYTLNARDPVGNTASAIFTVPGVVSTPTLSAS